MTHPAQLRLSDSHGTFHFLTFFYQPTPRGHLSGSGPAEVWGIRVVRCIWHPRWILKRAAKVREMGRFKKWWPVLSDISISIGPRRPLSYLLTFVVVFRPSNAETTIWNKFAVSSWILLCFTRFSPFPSILSLLAIWIIRCRDQKIVSTTKPNVIRLPFHKIVLHRVLLF